MTSTLPQEVRDAFERFITCEFTTVDAAKQPITWPVTPYYRQGDPTIDVTTGLGYPKKADDAAPTRASLLFSDPTGSGMESGLKVLVQGTATVDDADLKANADRYLVSPARSCRRPRRCIRPSPCGRCSTGTTPPLHQGAARARLRLAGWNLAEEPAIHDAHLEEVRSGHVEEPPEDHGAPAAGGAAWDKRLDFLEGHETGVLSWMGPDGFPIAVRVPFSTEPSRGEIAIEAEPAGLPLIEGRACLTVHRHAPDFSWQRNMQVRGNLTRSDEGWRLCRGGSSAVSSCRRGADPVQGLRQEGPGFYRTYRRRIRERSERPRRNRSDEFARPARSLRKPTG